MTRRLELTIPPTWQFVRQIKRKVEEFLAEHPESLRYSAGMVASELVGNAIKYGELTPQPTICVSVTDTQVEIEVKNAVKSPEHLSQVQMRLDQMAHSEDRAAFYLKRLQELLMDTPKNQGGQLGLYRIGYEGDFNLSYKYTDHVLTIRATRGLS